MTYFVSLTRARENRLKAQCNVLGVDYSSVNDMLSRMLRWGPELDLNAGFAPTRMPDETEYDAEANRLLYRFYGN
jgi:hypothetical protein